MKQTKEILKSRHAYLIMAHNKFEILAKLLVLLDDERNDIYLHIDQKVGFFDYEYYRSLLKKSPLYVTKRIDVGWGDYSQIECEYTLLKEAISRNISYQYYHFLSGVDLPLKTQDEIHQFFQTIADKEVVQLADQTLIQKRHAYYRISRYHFFSRYTKHQSKIVRALVRIMNFCIMPLQSLFHIDRLKNMGIEVGYGANWVSITDAFARYIVSQEAWVRKHFKYSLCADELLVQTLLVNSPFVNKVYEPKRCHNFNGNPCMRYIDWERGNPYVFTSADYKTLMNSDMLFARKFDDQKDADIIDHIYQEIKQRQEK